MKFDFFFPAVFVEVSPWPGSSTELLRHFIEDEAQPESGWEDMEHKTAAFDSFFLIFKRSEWSLPSALFEDKRCGPKEHTG